ncbi:hypothetical protein [Dryocola boscaweniae]|uniref:hypothetical protein n=1 Tax=Dryocola boscaweniae TaxID=2925397 RepID=UPI003F6A25E4
MQESAFPPSFSSIREIQISFTNDLDNHSHFGSMKHSKGYISEANNDEQSC